MRKSSEYILAAAVALFTLTGCGNRDIEPEMTDNNSCPSFSATITGTETRAFDRSWERGDEIGISGCNRSNVSYITKNGDGSFTVKTAGEQIYFHNDSETVFTAYYPSTNLAGGTLINTDTRTQSQQKNFDFLWAQASGKKDVPNVSFTFVHKMAKVVLTLRPGTGMTYEEMKAARLSLDKFRHTGSFNISDGSTTVNDVSEAWDFTEFAKFNDTEKNVTFSFILFPQSFDNPLDFLAVMESADNRNLSLKARIDFTVANSEKDGDEAKNEWVAGRQYNLSLTLNKTDISIGECVISPWNEVKGDEIIVD